MNRKTVFFSDLDRTLIFSKKFIKDGIESVVVESKGDKAISYMTKQALSLLKEIHNECTFIPVSTRTFETITRVDFIQEFKPEWMICDNGTHIYHNGERLKAWEDLINSKRDAHNLKASTLESMIKSTFEDKGLKEIFNREDIYLMVKFEEMSGEVRQHLECLNLAIRDKGYRMDINSRKAYFLPDYVRKEDAVGFLINEYGLEHTISAGDSLMDLEMLRKTTYAIAPHHKTFSDTFMDITSDKGMQAGEEILKYVKKIIK